MSSCSICSCEATRAKDVFAKYVESVLNKTAKIRTLIADLQKNYPDDETARKLLASNSFTIKAMFFVQTIFCAKTHASSFNAAQLNAK